MTNYGNKAVLSANLKRLMEQRGLVQIDIAHELGVSKSTVNDWVSARTYPRIDKIEMLANLLNCQKSDLIELRDGPHLTETYYIDPEVNRRAQELAARPQLALLMDASRHLTNEDLDAVLAIVERMTEKTK